MITKTCLECGSEFEAKRRDARYCTMQCRQRAHRSRSQPQSAKPSGNVIRLADRPRERGGSELTRKAREQLEQALGKPDGELEAAVRAQLDAAEVSEVNPDRVLALQLAKRLDHGTAESGSGIKALTAAFHAASDRALAAGKRQGDATDKARDAVEAIRKLAGS